MDQNTFCVLPWYSQEIGKKGTRPCCLLPENYDLGEIKQDLLNGVKSPSCAKCWTLEAQEKQSRRQQENIFLDYKLNKDLEKIQQDCVNGQHKVLMYQITTSNLCNQACVSCSSADSSRWAEIELKMGQTPKPVFIANSSRLCIDYKSAVRISLLGGEPLFDPRTFEILEKLLDAGNINCFISLVTNGSIELSSKQINLLSKFTDLNICLSIDGIGSVFEYMRWPGKWNALLKNIEKYRSIAHTVSVSYTISSLNALYFDRTVNWFKEMDLSYNHNIVEEWPTWLILNRAPIEIKNQLSDHEFFKKFAKINGNEISAKEMLKKIQAQDQVKNIKIQDYMPELYQLISTVN